MQTQNKLGPIASGVMASALKKLVVNLVCRWWWCKPICGLLKMRFHLEPDYSDTNGREGYKPARPGQAKPTTYIQLIVYHCTFMLGTTRRPVSRCTKWQTIHKNIKPFAFTLAFLIQVCSCLWSLRRYLIFNSLLIIEMLKGLKTIRKPINQMKILASFRYK